MSANLDKTDKEVKELQQKPNSAFRVAMKALLFFLGINLILMFFNPWLIFGNYSIYNHIVPGRYRFPFGENPSEAYNLSLYNVEAITKSHIAAGSLYEEDDYNVFILGDSSVWGTLLENDDTLAGQLNEKELTMCGRSVHVYNYGYPTISLTKDIMFMSEMLNYEPDLILWLVTLEAFPYDKQLDSPIVANNPERVKPLLDQLLVDENISHQEFVKRTLWDNTILGRRRELADIIRLQLYGFMWGATGIDQVYTDNYTPAQRDFEENDLLFHELSETDFDASYLAFELIQSGYTLAGDIPVIIINEPILVSSGQNSDIRYNFYYPKWVYDEYRELLQKQSENNNWDLIDLWNSIPENEFTNSAIHLTPAGSKMLSDYISEEIVSRDCQ